MWMMHWEDLITENFVQRDAGFTLCSVDQGKFIGIFSCYSKLLHIGATFVMIFEIDYISLRWFSDTTLTSTLQQDRSGRIVDDPR